LQSTMEASPGKRSYLGEGRGFKNSLSRFLQVYLTPNFGMEFILRGKSVTSQNVGQFRGRLEGPLCIASEITGYFRAFVSKT
jgi:hypothetical protein